MRIEDNIVALDLGTSSVRALLFDTDFASWPGLGLRKKYEFATRLDERVEVDPNLLLELTCECLDALHSQMADKGLKASGVAISTFRHCFLGLDKDEKLHPSCICSIPVRAGRWSSSPIHSTQAGYTR